MNPSEIRRLIAHAKILLVNSATTPEAFLILYVAWEALVRRILRIAFAAKGLGKRAADAELKKMHLSSKHGIHDAFLATYGSRLANLTRLGHLFRDIDAINKLRHRYVHGRGRASPQDFRKHCSTLLHILEANWEPAIALALKKQGLVARQANPYKRIVASKIQS